MSGHRLCCGGSGLQPDGLDQAGKSRMRAQVIEPEINVDPWDKWREFLPGAIEHVERADSVGRQLGQVLDVQVKHGDASSYTYDVRAEVLP